MPAQPEPFGNPRQAERRLRRLRAAFSAVSRRYDRAIQRRRQPTKHLLAVVIIGAICGATIALLLLRLRP
jgi:hypothetical protein